MPSLCLASPALAGQRRGRLEPARGSEIGGDGGATTAAIVTCFRIPKKPLVNSNCVTVCLSGCVRSEGGREGGRRGEKELGIIEAWRGKGGRRFVNIL